MEIFDFFKKIHDESLRHSEKIVFDKRNSLHFNLIALYSSLIELSGCIIILIDKNGNIGVPTIFRTFIETYVDLYNLIEDPKYSYFMEASFAKEGMKKLKEAQTGENPYLTSINKLPNLKELIDQETQKLKDLKSEGYTPLTIESKFKKAKMEKEYRSFYNSLCSDSHSNMSALIDRHFEMISKDDFEVVCYKEANVDDFILYIENASILLVEISIIIHNLFKTESLEAMQILKEELQKIRDKTFS